MYTIKYGKGFLSRNKKGFQWSKNPVFVTCLCDVIPDLIERRIQCSIHKGDLKLFHITCSANFLPLGQLKWKICLYKNDKLVRSFEE